MRSGSAQARNEREETAVSQVKPALDRSSRRTSRPGLFVTDRVDGRVAYAEKIQ